MITVHYEDTRDYFLERRYEGDDLDEAIELLRYELLLDYLPLNRSEVMQIEDKLRVAEKGAVIEYQMHDRKARLWWTERPTPKTKPHFTYGMGDRGYLFNYHGAAETEDEAIDAILANLNDGLFCEDIDKDERVFGTVTSSRNRWYGRDKTYRKHLKEHGWCDIHPLDGNTYAEYNECHCGDIDCHNEV